MLHHNRSTSPSIYITIILLHRRAIYPPNRRKSSVRFLFAHIGGNDREGSKGKRISKRLDVEVVEVHGGGYGAGERWSRGSGG